MLKIYFETEFCSILTGLSKNIPWSIFSGLGVLDFACNFWKNYKTQEKKNTTIEFVFFFFIWLATLVGHLHCLFKPTPKDQVIWCLTVIVKIRYTFDAYLKLS